MRGLQPIRDLGLVPMHAEPRRILAELRRRIAAQAPRREARA